MLRSFELIVLQTISHRASLLPTIATSLARMKNAESPSLRYKTAIFAARVIGESYDHGDCVIRGIEKGTWDVLLSSIKIPARSPQASREVERATSRTGVQVPIEECPRMDSCEISEPLFDQLQQRSPTFNRSQHYSLLEMEMNDPMLMSGSHGGHLESGADYTLHGPEMRSMCELDSSITADTISPYYTTNDGLSSLDVQSLTTFNEWLCSGEFTTGYNDTGASCETIISSGYDGEDVSFYKSYE